MKASFICLFDTKGMGHQWLGRQCSITFTGNTFFLMSNLNFVLILHALSSVFQEQRPASPSPLLLRKLQRAKRTLPLLQTRQVSSVSCHFGPFTSFIVLLWPLPRTFTSFFILWRPELSSYVKKKTCNNSVYIITSIAQTFPKQIQQR